MKPQTEPGTMAWATSRKKFAGIITPSVVKHLPYDVSRDFLPVTRIAVLEGALLLVHPSLQVRSVQELIALAKVKRLSYGSPGIGNSTPRAILERLHAEIRKALAVPKVRDVLIASGYEPKGEAPAEFQKIFQADLKRYAALARAARIEPE